MDHVGDVPILLGQEGTNAAAGAAAFVIVCGLVGAVSRVA